MGKDTDTVDLGSKQAKKEFLAKARERGLTPSSRPADSSYPIPVPMTEPPRELLKRKTTKGQMKKRGRHNHRH